MMISMRDQQLLLELRHAFEGKKQNKTKKKKTVLGGGGGGGECIGSGEEETQILYIRCECVLNPN